MLRIGICDDEQEMRFVLRYKLERILEGRDIENEIIEFSSGDRLISWYAKHAGTLELVFLDIEMDGSSGMETAKKLRSVNRTLQMVFVTGHPDFVFDGYAVGALDYLMKPPAADKLEHIVTRAMAALHIDAEEVFLCRNSEGVYRIPKSSILYFSSDKRQVTCAALSRNYTFYAKLDDVSEEVGSGFVRIHQRYIINVTAVERIVNNEVQVNGIALPISRAYQKTAMLALTRALLD